LSRSQGSQNGYPDNVRVVAWDGASPQGWGELVDGAQALVNLAGENIAGGRWTARRKAAILQSRLQAGQAVLQAVKQAAVKPRVLLQASAVGYYGPRNDDHQVTEKTPPGRDFLAQVCTEWEKSSAGVEQHGLRRVIMRIGVVLDARGGALPRMAQPFRLFVGGPVGSGRQWLPWIHLEDATAAMRFLIEDGRASGPFNLCAPNPVTNAQFGKALGRVLGRPSLVPAPAFAMRLLFGEMATVLLDGQRAVPRRLTELDFQFRFPELEPALRSLYGS
jgi:uncharacterized protein